MNILNLLIKEKRVAGIEISENVIRIAYFRPRTTRDSNEQKDSADTPGQELVFLEEATPENLVAHGAIIDKLSFGKFLKDLWQQSNIDTNYAIVSVPEEKIYSRILSFPKVAGKNKLAEAVNLAIDYQLPIKKSDSYIGWERIADIGNTNDILISGIPRTIADDYIEALSIAGIKILALESHLASIARMVNADNNTAAQFIKHNPDGGATLFIVKKGTLRFSRTLPTAIVPDMEHLTMEANRLKESFVVNEKMLVQDRSLEEVALPDSYTKYPEVSHIASSDRAKWLIAVSAHARGQIEEGQDTHISLLPVGTAEAYAFQKTTSFVILMRNIVISVCAFFILAYSTTYFFVLYLSQKANASRTSISTTVVSPETLKNEQRMRNINALAAASQSIMATTPSWSILLNEINTHLLNGILISNITVVSPTDPILLTGTAKDRNTLNQFKKSLQSSAYFTAVELPIANLELKGNVPFSVSFRIKDSSILYNK